MSVKLRYTLCSILMLSRYCECMSGIKGKFVIDNDAGGDDAMAIFLAALFEKYHAGPQLIGVTTSNGNTNEDNVSYNNQRILKVAKRQDVPIYRGSKSSLVKTPEITDYFGKDGLGDSGDVYPDLVPPHTENAVNALIHLSKTHEGNLTIITIGALTNLALAIKTDPTFLGRLAHVYIGAGHIHTEEYPTAEFNAHMDVEAYHVVTENANPEKVTIFPFSQVQKYCNFSREWRINVLGAIDTEIIRAQNKYERISLPREDRWQALDPATVALFLRPDLVQEYKYSKNSIALCGENRGITSNSFVDKEDANVRIAYSVKTEEYRQFLLDLFSNDA